MKRVFCAGESYALLRTAFKQAVTESKYRGDVIRGIFRSFLIYITLIFSQINDSRGYVLIKNAILIAFLVIAPYLISYGQFLHTVRGRVISEIDNTPLKDVEVITKFGGLRTFTNEKGEYTIKAGRLGEHFIFVKPGFDTLTKIGFNDRNPWLPITLRPTKENLLVDSTSIELEEVTINTGYYSVKDKLRTGNIARINAADIERQPVSNPLLALQGRLPGVIISQQSGVPGTALQIQIRGRNSLRPDGDYPLYIIDGVPMDSEPLRRDFMNNPLLATGLDPLNTINPQSIASIEILKDADATSIYGSRGANGVVLITTKSGKLGAPKLDVSYRTGMSNVPKMKMLNTEQYLEMRKEAFANENMEPDIWSYDLLVWDQNRYTDWQEVLIGNTARTHDANISLSGGSGGTFYRFNGGWRDEGMVFPGDMRHKLINAGINVSQKAFSDKLFLLLVANFGKTINTTSPQQFTNLSLTLAPNAPKLYNEDGSLNWENGTWYNPMAALEGKHRLETDNLNTNLSISYNLAAGLSLKSNVGYGQNRVDVFKTSPISSLDPTWLTRQGTAEQGNNTQINWNFEPQLVYGRIFQKLKIDALLGGTFQHNSSGNFTLRSSGYLNDALLGNTTAASTLLVLNNNKSKYRYNAIFSRIGVTWRDLLLFNLTARTDGSSRFGPGNRFGSFGAVGMGWIFSEHELIKSSIPLLSFGKIRGSYGTTGSDRIGDYGYLDSYSINNYRGNTSLSPSQLYNPTFQWEVNKKLDLELDLRFFEDRLFSNINWFRNRSSNQLVQYTLPAITGFSGVLRNLPATVQNTGWEFMIGFLNGRDKTFKIRTSVNMSIPENKLVAFPGIELSSYANTYIVGRDLSVTRRYEYVGLDDDGIFQIRDVNGDGRFDFNDRRDNIFEVRKRVYGEFQQTVEFRNILLDLSFEGVIQNGDRGDLGISGTLPGAAGVNQPISVLDRWRATHKSTNIQRYGYSTAAVNGYFNMLSSDLNIVDASFIRLRNISISYSLDTLTKRFKVSNLEIHFNGQNLFTLTKYKGWDPTSTMVSASLPALRTYMLGLKISI
jgi:TonB-linked SusC/RagA family outer membrane protein